MIMQTRSLESIATTTLLPLVLKGTAASLCSRDDDESLQVRRA